MANLVTKLQDVLQPKQEHAETSAVRNGKRIVVPAKDVERLYQQQRKRVVRVTYTGPIKITCRNCGTPSLSLEYGRGRYLNTTPMPVSRKHTGNEKEQWNMTSGVSLFLRDLVSLFLGTLKVIKGKVRRGYCWRT